MTVLRTLRIFQVSMMFAKCVLLCIVPIRTPLPDIARQVEDPFAAGAGWPKRLILISALFHES